MLEWLAINRDCKYEQTHFGSYKQQVTASRNGGMKAGVLYCSVVLLWKWIYVKRITVFDQQVWLILLHRKSIVHIEPTAVCLNTLKFCKASSQPFTVSLKADKYAWLLEDIIWMICASVSKQIMLNAMNSQSRRVANDKLWSLEKYFTVWSRSSIIVWGQARLQSGYATFPLVVGMMRHSTTHQLYFSYQLFLILVLVMIVMTSLRTSMIFLTKWNQFSISWEPFLL